MSILKSIKGWGIPWGWLVSMSLHLLTSTVQDFQQVWRKGQSFFLRPETRPDLKTLKSERHLHLFRSLTDTLYFIPLYFRRRAFFIQYLLIHDLFINTSLSVFLYLLQTLIFGLVCVILCRKFPWFEYIWYYGTSLIIKPPHYSVYPSRFFNTKRVNYYGSSGGSWSYTYVSWVPWTILRLRQSRSDSTSESKT